MEQRPIQMKTRSDNRIYNKIDEVPCCVVHRHLSFGSATTIITVADSQRQMLESPEPNCLICKCPILSAKEKIKRCLFGDTTRQEILRGRHIYFDFRGIFTFVRVFVTW